jgi:anti-sigma factor RsiW
MKSNFFCPSQKKDFGLLIDYAAGRLPAAARAKVERHAVDCPACQGFLADQSALWSALGGFTPAPISDTFDQRLWQRIGQEARASRWTRIRRWIGTWDLPFDPRPLAALSAVCALAVGIFVYQPAGERIAPALGIAADTGVLIETAEVETLERALEDLELLQTASL